MIITTIDLLNYLRCPRYAPLDRLSQERRYDKRQIDEKFQEMIFLSGASGNEPKMDVDEEENTDFDAASFSKDLMNSAMITLRKTVLNRLKTQLNGFQISEKKVISVPFSEEISLATQLDFFYDDHEKLNVITVLPMPDKELLSIRYSANKDKLPFFVSDLEGIFYPERSSSTHSMKSNYDEKYRKLTDRHHPLGRHIYFLAYKAFILSKLYPMSDQRHLMAVLNHSYVFDGLMDQSTPVYQNDLMTFFDMTYLVESIQPTIEIDLYRMINHIELNDDSRCLLVKNECCKNQPFECQFVDYCFSHLPEQHSILHYFYHHQGFVEKAPGNDIVHDTYDLINEGVVNMEDVPISWLHREKNLMQRYCVENDYTYVNKTKIAAYLATLKYPLYYLDFEAYPSILPRFKGETPYTQSVFQFSLHIEQENQFVQRNNPKTHQYYLSTDEFDHRLDLVKALVKAIPEDGGSVIVYNQTFEKSRLQELAVLYPEYAKRLLELSNRLFDLYKVVKNDPLFYQKNHFSKAEIESYNYYAPSLDGSYSLKKVLPTLVPENYDELPINNGEKAFVNYAKLPEMDEETKQSTIKNLLQYCQMDSYAMYLIKEALKSRI